MQLGKGGAYMGVLNPFRAHDRASIGGEGNGSFSSPVRSATHPHRAQPNLISGIYPPE